MLDVKILTIFPRIFDSFLAFGNPARAVQADLLRLETIDIRDFAEDRHRTTDDYPYGGGTGMVMKPEPVVAAIRGAARSMRSPKVILMTPQGRLFRQSVAEELALQDELMFVCGRYEGLDERIRAYVHDEISVGDYVLSGGETAAMSIIDAVVRLIPGVLGSDSHVGGDSFYEGLLEYPQYTRPRIFDGREVPEILLEGHHKKIEEWRRSQALARTRLRRPDLIQANCSRDSSRVSPDLGSEHNSKVDGDTE